MTTADRFERDLPMELEQLARPSVPDYLADILGRTAATSQRPAWTFPERWLPMPDVARRPAFVPRMPMRAIAAAVLIIALLAAGAVLMGTRQSRLPPPFGPAENGLVAYSANGDIFVADPTTGVVTPIVSGPEIDFYPSFSPDGTRIAFFRQVSSVRRDIVVVRADGSGLRVITTEPIWYENSAEWMPDSTAVIVGTTTRQLFRYDADRPEPPRLIAEGVTTDAGLALRPPDGGQILYDQPEEIPGAGIWVMNVDGSDPHPLFQMDGAATEAVIGMYRWSPDGTKVAFNMTPPGAPGESRIYVMNADGSDLRALTDADGVWVETDFVWSPDGMRIAFNRWQRDPVSDEWAIRPIGIATLADGLVLDAGPAPVSDGAVFEFSPDGTTFLSLPGPVVGGDPLITPVRATAIDTVTGEAHEVEWQIGSATSQQRLAIEP